MFAAAALFAPATVSAQAIPSFDAGKALALTPGQWSYVGTLSGSDATYGGALIIRCERATRTVSVVRPGTAGALTIVTSASTRTLPVGGRLSAFDPTLDAIAFSRGRILVAGGGPTLAIPAWPEAARSIEDCRI